MDGRMDHWITFPLEHRSLSGANKMADLEQDLQYQERGGLLQNDLIRLKAEKRALRSDYEWKEKRRENLKVMWNMLQLEEKNLFLGCCSQQGISFNTKIGKLWPLLPSPADYTKNDIWLQKSTSFDSRLGKKTIGNFAK